ncbi:MAG: pyridoxal phosphate-dependent aminotransferase [Janthinobacterium lividum]
MSKLRTSAMAPGAVQSEIRAMSVLSEQAGAINMAQGICDTEVPAVVREAAQTAIDAGNNIYTRLDGIARLRNAVAADWERRRGFPVAPDREVMVTNGATGAFYAAAMALLDPGDEAILFEPLYGYHAGTLASMHAKPVIVPLQYGTWALDIDAVRAAVTAKTRAIVINTPGNPSGKVFSQIELEALAEVALQNDLFVFSDEIYEHFVYPGHKHISMATLPGMRERTITFSGFSKTYSVTGWRIGYLVADARWTPSIGYFHDLVYICAPSPFQHGCAAGLEQLPPMFYTELASSHLDKRTRTLAALADAGLTPHTPDGAYYILADATQLNGNTAAEKSRDLLARTGVAAVAGSAFFRKGGGENLLRFCFAKRDADLDEACRRLRTLRN